MEISSGVAKNETIGPLALAGIKPAILVQHSNHATELQLSSSNHKFVYKYYGLKVMPMYVVWV